MKKILVLLLITAFVQSSNGQQVRLYGITKDTADKKNVSNAVIALLHKKDSTLAAFTRSDASGKFNFDKLDTGKYMLLVTYPKFADYVDDIDVRADKDLGTLPLTPTSVLLKEVVIRGGAAIRIKGDTTEFTADSFVVKEGATVEDLLKKLPGFQVNAKGEITAQGKRVEKVLVDGEEFFGDDPTMATQNLSAKIVDKVQVFDTKSEQQNLTGLSSGNEGKTINIKLKEDKKKGGFGKFHAGSDFDKVYDTKGLYNRFTGKKKLSLYGTKSSTNTGSLNWDDRQKLGMENDMEYDEIGGFYYSFGTDDGFNDWSLRGLPNSTTGGALYSNKWNADKQSFNGSYRFNRLHTENEGRNFSQLFLGKSPTPTNYRDVFTNSNSLNQQHAINGKYEWKFDSLNSLKLTVSGLRKTTDQYTETLSEFRDAANQIINKGSQVRKNFTTRLQTDNQLTYRRMFMKKNRLLIATFRFGITDDEQDGTLTTNTKFTSPDSTAVTDQYKAFNGNSKTLGGKVTFNEPLNEKWNLVLDYAHNRNYSVSNRNTFIKGLNDKYEVPDTEFSNNFDFDAFSHSGMAIMRYMDKKLKMSFGSGLSAVTLNLSNLDLKTDTSYNFLRFTPQAQVSYTFKPQTTINFNYRGTTRQPSIQQLQPVRDNNDQLNQFIGNPNLNVGFNHQFSTFFNQYKVLKQRGMWVSVSYNITNNAIVNSRTLDASTGKQSYTLVNTNGVHNWNFFGNWHKGGGPKKLGHGFTFNGNGGRSINFFNGNKNITDYGNAKLGVSTNYDVPDKWSIEFRPEVGYNRSVVNKLAKNNYFTYGGFASGFVMLPGKFELRSDVQFDLRERTAAFPVNSDIILVNGSLARAIFKKKNGKIFLVANDILNQNRGFSRNVNNEIISEDYYSRISRYFMLKFEWSFSKMPGTN